MTEQKRLPGHVIMCEICYFIEDNKPRREWKKSGGTKDNEPRARLLYPFPGGAEDITNYMSPKFKIRYCPKCGRRINKNGGKE